MWECYAATKMCAKSLLNSGDGTETGQKLDRGVAGQRQVRRLKGGVRPLGFSFFLIFFILNFSVCFHFLFVCHFFTFSPFFLLAFLFIFFSFHFYMFFTFGCRSKITRGTVGRDNKVFEFVKLILRP